VCADEQSWENAQHELMPRVSSSNDPSTTLYTIWQRYRLQVMCALLILAVYAGWWVWQRAQAGLDAIESELETEIIAELWRGGAVDAQGLGITNLPTDPNEIVTKVEMRDLGTDWAVVEVTLQPTAEGSSYRQTRVYGARERGWVRVQPTAARWGAERQLASKYFVFAYHTTDEDAVMQAAPQLDALYAEMYTYFHGSLVASEMLTITIDPEHSHAAGQLHPGIVVASPSASLVPSDVAPSEVLLQSLVLALYDHLAKNAFTAHGSSGQRLRLLNALRLWFIWEYDLPLGVWREPLVQWVAAVPHDTQHRDAVDIPAFARDLCAHHTLWVRYPLDVAIPILCWQNGTDEEQIRVWRYQSMITYIAPSSLLYGAIANVNEESAPTELRLPEPGPYAILLATVFEYVTATHGRDKLPRLLAAIPQHQRAETLIPAVFGVTAKEFQADWQADLAEHYMLKDER
jgi:hypothetical protein